jgi:hypothetical protein
MTGPESPAVERPAHNPPEIVAALCLAFGVEYSLDSDGSVAYWARGRAEAGPDRYDTFADALRAAVLFNIFDPIFESLYAQWTEQSARLATVTRERDEARRWAEETVAAVVAERVVTCVYCGLEYPHGTPASQDAALTAHIKVCEKHPMRALESEVALLRSQLAAVQRDRSETRPAFTLAEVRDLNQAAACLDGVLDIRAVPRHELAKRLFAIAGNPMSDDAARLAAPSAPEVTP